MEKEVVFKLIGEKLTNIFKRYKVVLAGGAIRCLYCQSIDNGLKNEVKDLDIYFKNIGDFTNLYKELLDIGYYNIIETRNAITLCKLNNEGEKVGYPIQLIKLPETIGGEEAIFNTFDFTICSGIFDFETEEFHFAPTFEKDNKEKKIVFNINTLYPISSLIRVNKYIKKGYTISNIEYLKIALKISQLEIENYSYLKEQLLGIDTLLLKPLTDRMLEGDEKCDINEFLNQMEEYLNERLDLEEEIISDSLLNKEIEKTSSLLDVVYGEN